MIKIIKNNKIVLISFAVFFNRVNVLTRSVLWTGLLILVMRNRRLIIGLIFLLFYVQVYSLEKENILIISSKSTDNSNVDNLMRNLMLLIKNENLPAYLKIEAMNCLDWNEANQWGRRMRNILNKYSQTKRKAIILVGPEAWGTYLGLDSVPKVPYYVSYVCRDGIVIPEHLNDSVNWKPTSTNLFKTMLKNRSGGGSINFLRIQANIRLC